METPSPLDDFRKRLRGSTAMYVVTVATQKGGASKTTILICLAVIAMQLGYRVAILDLDHQASAMSWGERRSGPPLRILTCDQEQLAATLEGLRADAFDIVFIDTPGTHSDLVTAALASADLNIVPIIPTTMDLQGTLPTARVLSALRRPFAFVLTQCPHHVGRITPVQAMLDRLAARAGEPLHYRLDFQDAIGSGQGVTEYNPKGAAAREALDLWNWTAAKLGLRAAK